MRYQPAQGQGSYKKLLQIHIERKYQTDKKFRESNKHPLVNEWCTKTVETVDHF